MERRPLLQAVAVFVAAVWVGNNDNQEMKHVSGIAGAARRARIDRELQDRSGELWRLATAVAGPLLFGYVYWILTRARERGLRRLYFLARDGQILLRTAELIAQSCGMHLELRYLHASRRAWFLPSVAFGSAQEREAAVLTDPEVSIETLLSSLEVEPVRVQDCLEAAGFPRSTWHRQVPVERLKSLLCAAPFDGLLQERAAGEYALCMEYLTEQGMFDPVAKAIVDVGWKGRLQTALARLSPRRSESACSIRTSTSTRSCFSAVWRRRFLVRCGHGSPSGRGPPRPSRGRRS